MVWGKKSHLVFLYYICTDKIKICTEKTATTFCSPLQCIYSRKPNNVVYSMYFKHIIAVMRINTT